MANHTKVSCAKCNLRTGFYRCGQLTGDSILKAVKLFRKMRDRYLTCKIPMTMMISLYHSCDMVSSILFNASSGV